MLGSVRAVTVWDIMREYALDRIDLLKLDVEGSEKEIFAVSDEWIGSVDAICLELHDRFKAGCSRNFFSAVREFPIEVWRGEDVLVARDRSQLTQPAAMGWPRKASHLQLADCARRYRQAYRICGARFDGICAPDLLLD